MRDNEAYKKALAEFIAAAKELEAKHLRKSKLEPTTAEPAAATKLSEANISLMPAPHKKYKKLDGIDLANILSGKRSRGLTKTPTE